MFAFRQRWQQRKVRDFISRVQPEVIGVVGTSNSSLTAAAVELVLGPHRQLSTSLLEAAASTALCDAVLLDMAAPIPGAVDRLASATPFSHGIVTDVGSHRLDLFGGKDMVAHELMSLPASLAESGCAILNFDDELVATMAAHTRVVSFGTNSAAAIRLIRSRPLPHIGFAIEIAVGARHYQGSVPHLIHFPHVYAALAALALAHALGLDIKESMQNLTALKPLAGRLDVKTSREGAHILDGSAFATPESTHAALHTLHTCLPAGRLARRIAILGDIENLGIETPGAHKRIGRAVIQAAHIFIAVGQNMRYAGAEALKINHGPDVHHFESAPEVGEWLAPYIRPDDTILVMGSPAMEMEKVVQDLQKM